MPIDWKDALHLASDILGAVSKHGIAQHAAINAARAALASVATIDPSNPPSARDIRTAYDNLVLRVYQNDAEFDEALAKKFKGE